MGIPTEDTKSASGQTAKETQTSQEKYQDTQQLSEIDMNERRKQRTSRIYGILLLGILGFIIWTGFGVSPIAGSAGPFYKPEIRLTAMMISGVLVLVISMGFLAYLYSVINQNDPQQALGLPKGSVRAIVALLLMVLFAILAVFYFNQLNDDKLVTQERIIQRGLTADQVEQLSERIEPKYVLSIRPYEEFQIVPDPSAQSDSEITSVDSITNTAAITPLLAVDTESLPPGYKTESITLYEVTRVVEIENPNPESQRFAQQVLTTIGTLVVAVAGFYFGTRAVATAGRLAQQSADLAEQDRIREAILKEKEKISKANDEVIALQKKRSEIDTQIEAALKDRDAKIEAENAIGEKVKAANKASNRYREASVACAEARDHWEEVRGAETVDDEALEKATADLNKAEKELRDAEKESLDAKDTLENKAKLAAEAGEATAQTEARLASLQSKRDDLDLRIQKAKDKSAASTAHLADLDAELQALERGETPDAANDEDSGEEQPAEDESQ